MSDPNLITVFDTNGDSFETTRANARDLVNHVGWTYNRPIVVEKIIPAAPAVAETAAAPADEETADAAEDEVFDADTATGVELFTTVEQFAGLDRAAVVAYLADNFPDYNPHHRSGLEKLIEDAIKLAGE